MSYGTKRVEAEQVEATLIDIWRRNLQVSGDLRQRFDWTYRQNPDGPGATFLIEHGGDGEEATVVGSTSVFARCFAVDGRSVESGILGDVAVDNAHRTLFPALMLQKAARRDANERIGLLYGFPNELAQPLYKRLGFHQLGSMVRYARPLGIERYARAQEKLPSVLGAAARIVDIGWRQIDAIKAHLSPTEHPLEWTDQIDARFDELWARARTGYRVVGCRTAEFLRWRFTAKPDERFRFATLTHEKLEAYAVIQTHDQVAHIRDLFGSSPAHIDMLIARLIPTLRMEGLEAVSMRFVGAPWLVPLLQHHQFRAREASWPVIVDPCTHLDADPDLVRDPSNWYLTDSDEDT